MLTTTYQNFIVRYLGQPYEESGRHCWWLAGLTQREVFGRDVPLGPPSLPAYDERHRLLHEGLRAADWASGEMPEEGDLVLMAAVPGGPDIHCGTFFDGLGVFHTNRLHGVVLDPIVELEAVQSWSLSYWRPPPKVV